MKKTVSVLLIIAVFIILSVPGFRVCHVFGISEPAVSVEDVEAAIESGLIDRETIDRLMEDMEEEEDEEEQAFGVSERAVSVEEIEKAIKSGLIDREAIDRLMEDMEEDEEEQEFEVSEPAVSVEDVEEAIKSGLIDRKTIDLLMEGEEKPEKRKKEKIVPRKRRKLRKLSPIEKIFRKRASLSVSRDLKQFGYDLFKKPATTFAPVTSVPVGPDYVLGTGDNLIIYVWGKVVQERFSVVVDRDGKINLPKAGNIYVWGLKFPEAEKLIKKSLTEYYANLQMSVSMGRLRTIKVFVLGEVQRPGAYTISSLSTVFHALYEAGGPSKLGTLRQIKLVRGKETIDGIDLYRLFLTGDKSQDHRLQSNDIVFVPTIGQVSGVAGNVKRPGIYEMNGLVNLSDLIQMSGGLTPAGYLRRVQLERIHQREKKIVIDLELSSMNELIVSAENVAIQDGDLVLVFPILPLRYNFVSVEGNILRPGDYALEPGMKVMDLINKADGIDLGTYLKRAEIFRFKDNRTRETVPVDLEVLFDGNEAENVTLRQWDRLVIYSESDVLPKRRVRISGAVYKPGKYKLTPNMKLTDLIFKAGGLKPAASLENAELFRIGTGEKAKVLRVELAGIVETGAGENSLVLQDGDHLYVRVEEEWVRKKVIILKGQIKYPGKYVAEKDETLSSILKRAGGFTKGAYLDGAVYTRVSIRHSQEEKVRQFVKREQQALLQKETSISTAQLTGAEKEIYERTFERRRELLELVTSIKVPGRMMINLDEPDRLAGAASDILIEDGDALSVPQVPSSVHVIGSVYNPSSIIYEEGKNLLYYLAKVGGFTKHADKKSVHVVRANGEVETEFMRLKIMKRGDTIVVPEKLEIKTNMGKLALDISKFIYNIAVGVSVLD